MKLTDEERKRFLKWLYPLATIYRDLSDSWDVIKDDPRVTERDHRLCAAYYQRYSQIGLIIDALTFTGDVYDAHLFGPLDDRK